MQDIDGKMNAETSQLEEARKMIQYCKTNKIRYRVQKVSFTFYFYLLVDSDYHEEVMAASFDDSIIAEEKALPVTTYFG